MKPFEDMHPSEIRKQIREQKITGTTAGMAKGYTQANLVILKKKDAFDFLLFCQRNPKPCPLLDITEPGNYHPVKLAKHGDIRTDFPKYRIYRDGVLIKETTQIIDEWEDDMVGFLIGCSFTFEGSLIENGIPIRHIDVNSNVPMYKTNILCEKAGLFEGPLVVSMRPMTYKNAIRSIQITSRFPSVHGAPVHIGDPCKIGIIDLNYPDFGDAVPMKEDEIPVFWACGVTPQAVALQSKPTIMITHAPGHMFISDVRDENYSIL